MCLQCSVFSEYGQVQDASRRPPSGAIVTSYGLKCVPRIAHRIVPAESGARPIAICCS